MTYTPTDNDVREAYVHHVLSKDNRHYVATGREPLTATEANAEFDAWLDTKRTTPTMTAVELRELIEQRVNAAYALGFARGRAMRDQAALNAALADYADTGRTLANYLKENHQ